MAPRGGGGVVYGRVRGVTPTAERGRYRQPEPVCGTRLCVKAVITAGRVERHGGARVVRNLKHGRLIKVPYSSSTRIQPMRSETKCVKGTVRQSGS